MQAKLLSTLSPVGELSQVLGEIALSFLWPQAYARFYMPLALEAEMCK